MSREIDRRVECNHQPTWFLALGFSVLGFHVGALAVLLFGESL